MDRIATALTRLTRLADSLDRQGLFAVADAVDGIARRAVRLFQTPPKGKEEFLGHTIEHMPGNVAYVDGPLLSTRQHELLLEQEKRKIERRDQALKNLIAKLPPDTASNTPSARWRSSSPATTS